MDDLSGNRVKLVFAVAIFLSRRPHVKESGFRNRGNFLLWNRESGKIRLAVSESWTLKFGIQLKESVIPLTIGIRNPSVTDKETRTPVAGTRNLRRGIQNPRLYSFGFLYVLGRFSRCYFAVLWLVFIWKGYALLSISSSLSDHLAGYFRDRMFCVSSFQLWLSELNAIAISICRFGHLSKVLTINRNTTGLFLPFKDL